MIISIHAPPRGATASGDPQKIQQAKFQFTPLREGRRSLRSAVRPDRGTFQFTPLREGRRGCARCRASSRWHFNSRPSARGDLHHHVGVRPRGYFNSRPSARGDRAGLCEDFQPEQISIHAPPRGATRIAGAGKQVGIFQFTPLREGRLMLSGYFYSHYKFQFTPLREGRLQNIYTAQGDLISIHAPPRGATCSYFCIRGRKYFNSRPSARGDHRRRSRDGSPVLFQFTPLREGRLWQYAHTRRR